MPPSRDDLFTSVPAMLALASVEGELRSVNPAWERVLGPAGPRLGDLAEPSARAAVDTALAAPGAVVETPFAGAGPLRWSAVNYDDGLLIAAAVPDPARAELAAVASAASHDLRAPLRAIDGFARLLLRDEDALDAAARRYLGLVLDAVSDLTREVDAVVEAARAGLLPLAAAPVEVAALAEELGAHVEGEVPAVDADRDLLRRALAAVGCGAEATVRFQEGALVVTPGRPHLLAARVAARHGGRAWGDGTSAFLRLGP